MKVKFEKLEFKKALKLQRETMRQIVFYSFKKAKEESLKATKTGLAKHISETIENDYNEYISVRTFVRYYDEFIEQKGEKHKNRDREILNFLSKYIGYESFVDYYDKNIHKND